MLPGTARVAVWLAAAGGRARGGVMESCRAAPVLQGVFSVSSCGVAHERWRFDERIRVYDGTELFPLFPLRSCAARAGPAEPD